MYPARTDNIVAFAKGPKGDQGSLNQSDIDALLGGVATDGNTLAKLRALIALCARLDSPALTGTPTAPTLSAGNTSTKIANAYFTHQEIENRALTLQPKDAMLTALAALVTSADQALYFTGPDAPALSTLTAFIRTLFDDPDAATAAATLAVLRLAGGTLTGALTLAADPTAALHAATKQYVDTVAQGLDAKASVRAGTTANITLSGAQTIDGVSVVAGDRVLVKNQTTTAQNGIYVAASGAWSRAADADSWAEYPGAFTFVEEGTVNGDCGFVCTVNAGGTLGTTAIAWTQFSGAGTYTAGTGLGLTGTQFNITDPELLALAGVTSAANKVFKFTGSGTGSLIDSGAFGETLLAAATAAIAKTALAIAAADITDASANGRSLLTAANYAAMKTLLAVAAADITDASANGRSLITAVNYAAMKALLAVAAADITDASANGRSFITAANYAAMKTLLSLVKGDVGLGNVVNLDTSTQANVAFTGLTAAAAAADTDTFPVNQGALNLKQTFAAVKTWVKSWIAKADVGLGNVDNTSDATKNSAVATLTNKTITAPAGLVAGDVGLGNVTNTSDANKPVSTAQQAALDQLVAANVIPANAGLEVWQRGATLAIAASTTAYTADRWAIKTGANQACSVSRQPGLSNGSRYCARVVRSSGQTGTTALTFEYPLDADEVLALRGNKATIAMWLRAGSGWTPASANLSVTLYTGTGTAAKRSAGAYIGDASPIAVTQAITTTATRYSFTSGSALGTTITQASLVVTWTPVGPAPASDYFEIDDVLIVPGATAPVFPVLPFSFDLRNCQAHFCKNFDYGTAPADGIMGYCMAGFALATTLIDAQRVNFPVPMRGSPTVTPYSSSAPASPPNGVWGWYLAGTGWQNASATAPGSGGADKNELGFMPQLTVSGATAAGAYIVSGGWTADAGI